MPQSGRECRKRQDELVNLQRAFSSPWPQPAEACRYLSAWRGQVESAEKRPANRADTGSLYDREKAVRRTAGDRGARR